MIKAVFFDIDGTLVSFKTHKVPQSTREAIAALRDKGIKVFIATGRHFASINNLGDLQFDGYITMNGSYCFAGKDEVIYKHDIKKDDLTALLDYMDAGHRIPCVFVREHDLIINYIDQRVKDVLQMLDFPQPPTGDLREALKKNVYQLIAFFGTNQEEEFMKIMPDCDATRWSPLFTDVVPKGSSKRIGIDQVIGHYGIQLKETLAFGDGGNDIPMLQHAGIGVAMGNATDDVKLWSDFVTSSVDEDGIMHALKVLGVL